MPITPTYPGIYIEEILSNAHTIQGAPTSVTVFVGYTHPFLTPPQNYLQAVEIFSFSDYEREFGGLFSVDWLTDDVGRAVYQFFLNGGSDAFVVALQPQFNSLPGGAAPVPATISPPSLTIPGAPASNTGILFTGLQPVDASRTLTVSITNPRASAPSTTSTPAPDDLADVIVSYGTTTETYRRVTLDPSPPAADAANTLELRVGTAANPVSALVQVSVPSGNISYPTSWPLPMAPTPLTMDVPSTPYTTYSPGDFGPAFAQDNPLDKLPVFNLLATPGVWDPGVVSEGLAFCERKQAFMIVDPPADTAADLTGYPLPMIGDVMSDNASPRTIPKSVNGALYFPFLRSPDPITGSPLTIAPSGFVTGVIAREDTNRGVWKAPAGLETVISNTTGVAANGQMTDMRQGTLNPLGVNCIRGFPGVGTVVFGARTLVSANPAFQQYRYIPVRRTALFLEQSLKASLTWVIFEPNDSPLWVTIRTTIENFMLGLFNQGAFQGSTPSTAFQVTCDATTTTPDDQANGIVNIVVAFAPLKPAEFVVIKIAQLAGQPQS